MARQDVTMVPAAAQTPAPTPAAPQDCNIATNDPDATLPPANDINHAAVEPPAMPAAVNPISPSMEVDATVKPKGAKQAVAVA